MEDKFYYNYTEIQCSLSIDIYRVTPKAMTFVYVQSNIYLTKHRCIRYVRILYVILL